MWRRVALLLCENDLFFWGVLFTHKSRCLLLWSWVWAWTVQPPGKLPAERLCSWLLRGRTARRLRGAPCTPRCAAVRQAEGPRPAGWHGARCVPGDPELAKLRFPRLPCRHLPCSSSCVQLRTRPSTAHLLSRVGRSHHGAYKWWLPTSEPGPSPAETGVGHMAPELAGASARRVLGPGQRPRRRRRGVCTCSAPRGLAVASPAELSRCFAQLCGYLLAQILAAYSAPWVFLSRPHPLKRSVP